MPNWVYNCITVAGPKEDIEALLAKVHTQERLFDFNGLVPMPEIFCGDDDAEVDGDDWYSWSIKHWGTKCNAYDIEVSYRSGNREAHIEFDTAWCAPVPVFEAMHQQFPALDIYVEYADEDLGSNCGTWHNGTLKEETDPNAALAFSCKVWGYDLNKILAELED